MHAARDVYLKTSEIYACMSQLVRTYKDATEVTSRAAIVRQSSNR